MGEILEVINLKKVYRRGREQVSALKGISFSVSPGEIVGLLGPNGAGKTTTIKCISNLIFPTDGKVFVKGRETFSSPGFLYTNLATVLEGNRNIYWRLTVRENLEFFAGLQGFSKREIKKYADELIEFFGLQEKVNTQGRFLSRGMQQKLAVACAFIKRTDILLLDEPTLGLDVEATHDLKRLIKSKAEEEGRTILLSSHNMGLVEEVCERVIIINHGKIVATGRVEDLKGFFTVNRYRFEIKGSLDQELLDKMRKEFLNVLVKSSDGKTILEIEIKNMERIYDVFDCLREARAEILKIDMVEPDFEEVYLKIVKGE